MKLLKILNLKNLNTERYPGTQLEDGPVFFNLEVNGQATTHFVTPPVITTPVVITPVLSADGTIWIVNTVRTRRPRRTKAQMIATRAGNATAS